MVNNASSPFKINKHPSPTFKGCFSTLDVPLWSSPLNIVPTHPSWAMQYNQDVWRLVGEELVPSCVYCYDGSEVIEIKAMPLCSTIKTYFLVIFVIVCFEKCITAKMALEIINLWQQTHFLTFWSMGSIWPLLI